MKKKTPVAGRTRKAFAMARADDREWHNGADVEIHLYARSLRKAATRLVSSLDLEPNPGSAWDACPAIAVYKQAVELHMKLLIGEGCNFLPSPPDPLTLYKTHSLRWLAQIVCQIVKGVRWEHEFRCEGVTCVADFSAVVDRLESMDPVSWLVQPQNRRPDGWVPAQLLPTTIVQFSTILDAILDLLDSTADALAATRDQVSSTDAVKPTIQ